MKNNFQISPLTQVVLSVGVASYLICLGWQTATSNNTSLDLMGVKLEATSKLNNARKQSEELQKVLTLVQEQKQAYDNLEAKYNRLSRHNEVVRQLEPELEQLQVNTPSSEELEAIEEGLSNTVNNITEDIEKIVNPN